MKKQKNKLDVSDKEIKKLEKELSKMGSKGTLAPTPNIYRSGLKLILSNDLGVFFTDESGYLYKLICITKEFEGKQKQETLLKPIRALNIGWC